MSVKSGIYKIENLINGSIYIGRSCNILKRWHNHKSKLKKNIHNNKELQKDWNLFGEYVFKFEILEICNRDYFYKQEDFWIKELDTYNNGYNKTTGNNGGWSKYSQNTINEMLLLYNNRNSIPMVAKLLDIPIATVKDIICKSGISRSYKEAKQIYYEDNTIFTDENVKIMVNLYNEGKTCSEIAEIFNSNTKSVNIYLINNDVCMRNRIEVERNKFNIIYTDNDIINLLYKHTFNEIHEITKLSISTISKIKKRNGIKINKRIPISNEEISNILHDYSNKMSIVKLSKKYNRRDLTIKKIIDGEIKIND